ncbi:alanine--tRNA ligase [Artemisia annua]|uniref:Alanine--tRNA ligase n=1 Tax=Artemisia annua TaxID=35608 RepID=A0A2U1LRA1_ARTAN|nr:alanine--tRNA ligase [Artemisia annua]
MVVVAVVLAGDSDNSMNGAYKISIHRNCKFQAIKQRTRSLFELIHHRVQASKDAQNGYGFEKVDSVYGSTFPMVYPDPVRIVTVGRKVENLLADPENKEWLSILVELYKGGLICTRGQGFYTLSKEGIARQGNQRVTAVTTDYMLLRLLKSSST